jgi:leucyl aminopeptidase
LTDAAEGAVPIWPVRAADFDDWRAGQPDTVSAWVAASRFKAKADSHLAVPGPGGGLAGVVLGLGEGPSLWSAAGLPKALPAGRYRFEPEPAPAEASRWALGWALGAYRFERYKAGEDERPELAWPAAAERDRVEAAARATGLVRDLINTPAADMGPAELAGAAAGLAAEHGAACTFIEGEELLAENYPMIHAVGRASPRAPRLIDLTWGPEDAPRVTLVGKGVCFDSGGLDLKSAAGMRQMKKDMGGGAIVLGLAHMVMAAGLPVRLRVLVPAVENSVAGEAYRPGDILATRQGLSVEVGNTDAEGRLVLADALAAADADKPELLIDCATLTGAARVALGPELPALFTADDTLAADLARHSEAAEDPLWRLPLWAPYAKRLESQIADLNNVSEGGHAGAVTAALFLSRFVTETPVYAHLDLFAWNDKARPGRPLGGEAMAMRALFALIEERFGG